MRQRWILPNGDDRAVAELSRALAVSPLLAQCLVNRGFAEAAPAAAFLAPRLRDLADPERLPGMERGVDRLVAARERGEATVIFGDYDVDGVTATALLQEVLTAMGLKVATYLPHRLDEGYGLTRDAVENCLQQSPASLVLAVDCGSTAVETITALQSRGVEVIVLDHHQPASPPPPAVALINPHAGPSGPGSFHELCSVGLAFKLAHALVKRGRQLGWPAAQTFDLKPLLDLVALGTIADLVPLKAENRILVSAGLGVLNRTRRPGLDALCRVAQVATPIGPYEVGFQLAPRLNAAGRLETASAALQLIQAADEAAALPIARQLDAQNRERQQIERGIATEVIQSVRARFQPEADFVIVEGKLVWHIGVVGIVASRVLQEFYRPTLILGGDGYAWRGSGRSIEGFDLASALRECHDLLLRHGGHAMAAGVTLEPDKLPLFRDRLNRLARERLSAEQLRPPLRLDALVPLADLTLGRMEELQRLEPRGHGNPAVQLVVPGVRLSRAPQRIGREQQHVKLHVTSGGTPVEVVWWNGGDKPWPDGRFDLACAPQINAYDGRRTVQLRLLDWRPATAV